MSECIERLSVDDYDEAIEFLNMVFGKEENKDINLTILQPKMYRPTAECMNNNFAIRKNGYIRALVTMYPMTAQSGSRILKVAGIGGVSTHPEDCNTGMMQHLMEACIREMISQGFHMSCLGGLRQRYGYFGYEKGGTAFRYNITKYNIKHYLREGIKPGIHFEKIEKSHASRLLLAKKLYDTQPFYCNRPSEEFYLYLKSWNKDPWAALDNDGHMLGYLVANEAGNMVDEIQASNTDEFFRMACQWVVQHEENGTSFFIPPWADEYARKAGGLCEDVSVRESYNWRIFDWVEVIDILLVVKSGYTRLVDGETDIHIKDYGTVRIKVKDNITSCEKTPGKANLVCDNLTSVKLIFGPTSPVFVAKLPEKESIFLNSWFPLPLCWLPQDGI